MGDSLRILAKMWHATADDIKHIVEEQWREEMRKLEQQVKRQQEELARSQNTISQQHNLIVTLQGNQVAQPPFGQQSPSQQNLNHTLVICMP